MLKNPYQYLPFPELSHTYLEPSQKQCSPNKKQKATQKPAQKPTQKAAQEAAQKAAQEAVQEAQPGRRNGSYLNGSHFNASN